MDIEVRIRVTCTTAHCSMDRTRERGSTRGPTVFDGWVAAMVTGNSHFVRLTSCVPPEWTTRTMEGSGEPEPICPACSE